MIHQTLFAAMVGLALAASSPAVSGRQPEPGGRGDQVQFTYYQRCIFIQMQVDHHENLLFLVDTGASASAIDLNAAERLRLVVRGAVKIEGTASVINARTAVIPSLSVGKVHVGNTGASLFETRGVYLNVTETTWRRLTDLDPGLVAERYFQGSGPGGTVRLPVARLKECAIGGIVVTQPYVIVQPSVGYFARTDAVGFISDNFLERYSPVTIDYRKRRLYLSQSATAKFLASEPPSWLN